VRLIKDWLTNEHVILGDDVLHEMREFVGSVNGSQSLGGLIPEVEGGLQVRMHILQ
jgi:hypothetical protein